MSKITLVPPTISPHLESASTSTAPGPSKPDEKSSNIKQPSPQEAFSDYLRHVTSTLDRLTTLAAALPPKSDLAFHKTMDPSFGKAMDAGSLQVLEMAEKLLGVISATQGGKGKSKRNTLENEEDVTDEYRRAVGGVVDGLLEDADEQLDELRGEKKAVAIQVTEAPPQGSSSNSQRKRPGYLPAHIRDAQIPKPQLQFDPPIDNNNSPSPWQHSLSTKLHSIVPLSYIPPLNIDYTPEEELDPTLAELRKAREIKLRTHPYYHETRNLVYPQSLFNRSEPIIPKPMNETPYSFIDTPEQLEEMVTHLKSVTEIAVDLEYHSTHSFAGFTCLIQISTRERDYIVDAIKLRSELRRDKLGGVMVDPSIVKVFHGSQSDIPWLQQDFSIFVVGLFDTFHATLVLNFPAHSLASLLKLYCNFDADKRYQLADWRIRPLPEEMEMYARADTHFLLYIYDKLRNALLDKSVSLLPTPVGDKESKTSDTAENGTVEEGHLAHSAMKETLERSAQTSLIMYQPNYYDEKTGRGSGGWREACSRWLPSSKDTEAGAVFKALHSWRDSLARNEDESPVWVLPNDKLVALSKQRPSTLFVVQKIIGNYSPLALRHAADILSVIASTKASFTLARNPPAISLPPPNPESLSSIDSSVQTLPKPPINGDSDISPEAVADVSTALPEKPVETSTWDDLWSVFTPKKQARSELFGNFFTSSRPAPTVAQAQSKVLLTMFGSTLGQKPARALSPGFAEVLEQIRVEMVPPIPSTPTSEDTQQAPARAEKQDQLVPETVPFVPSTKRTTISTSFSTVVVATNPGPSTEGASATKAKEEGQKTTTETVTKEDWEDAVVSVKKSRKRTREPSSGSTVGTPILQKTVTPSSTPSVEKEQKVKKVKFEVPEYDYASQPDPLSNPQSLQGPKADKDKKGKGKKEKNKGTGSVIEIPRFGNQPKDMSQPKVGNKSKTF
ncbi:hypothetical protein TREMEDRAFT_70822 [Tremella mesenterica DSM 1558]|uniref:uncharacterized protein n=1 Tax=Tremella mesenterica (strain ATCC 24925 / CBS 8224 / DSM 1558 / NBRC 9311 / NRRL Y-6157 / RJB 2259-6 / UBC 559-6) TaxID=578456 RepID=UPI0003F49E41|nr:uncharacterized protein TREMEDRAFT_70822 [Tremella mesenterica DSM 1558]EIW72816.1 hypothetical protein TREMEDRAFT_70822 [Tremella mesenterica DSM 1558]